MIATYSLYTPDSSPIFANYYTCFYLKLLRVTCSHQDGTGRRRGFACSFSPDIREDAPPKFQNLFEPAPRRPASVRCL
jgi:hypothetical protein